MGDGAAASSMASRWPSRWPFVWRGLWPPLAVLLVGLALWPWRFELSRPLDDALEGLLAPRQVPEGLLIVDIDDQSLVRLEPTLGPWPYPRDVHARVIAALRAAGARAIALDLLLPESRAGDAALADELRRPGAPVLLAAAGLPPLRHAGDRRQPPLWSGLVLPATSLWPGPQQPPPLGIVTLPLDSDGVLRAVPLWQQADGLQLPLLPLALWRAEHPGAALPDWPVDGSGRVALRLPCCALEPPHLALSELWPQVATGLTLDPALRERIHGRVVVIGSSALLGDRVMTLSGQRSGAEVLALTYGALRDGWLIRPPPAWLQALALLFALAPSLRLTAAALGRVQRHAQPSVQPPPLPRPGHSARWHLLGLALLLALWVGALALAGVRLPIVPAFAMLGVSALLLGALQLRRLHAEQRALQEQKRLAEAASEAKSTLLANVSHEMRTPLNALLGVAELLGDTSLDPRQRDHVLLFTQAGRTLAALIDDLLDLARIEAGRFELDPAPQSLQPLFEETLQLLRPSAAGKGVRLELQITALPQPVVLIDALRFKQMLTNLLGNAIKFTDKGRVRMLVQPHPAPAGDARPWLSISVSDTGIGIAPNRLEAIFEPFVQAGGAASGRAGSGLGLPITRALAQQMSGHIEVDSSPGRGSRFTLTLPTPPAELPADLPADLSADLSVVASPPTAAEASAPVFAVADAKEAAALSPAPGRVLLADDDPVSVYLMSAMLEGTGLELEVSGDGPAAFKRLREERFDLVITELALPGLDGLQLLRELRRHEAVTLLPRTPALVLAAASRPQDRLQSRAAGGDLHLDKPCTRRQLLDSIALLRSGGAGGRRSGGPDEATTNGVLSPPPRPERGSDRRPAAASGPVLRDGEALLRLGGDRQLHRRVVTHARVFLDHWLADQAGATPRRRLALARDLKSIAFSIGADELAAAATRLEAALAAADAGGHPAGPGHEEAADALDEVREQLAAVRGALASEG